ncbi:MAG: response regulator transcription factor [Bacteroidetes bacterium]|nr:MAG: response regulator transcription factor [Bacteroidota bacterium]
MRLSGSSSYQILFFCLLFWLPVRMYGQELYDESHTRVSMRMIGHRVLLAFGDSSSRVLPVERDENRYQISFASDFAFEPSVLKKTIDEVVLETRMASQYVVEVQQCNTGEIVYGYEITASKEKDVIPCKGRKLERDCYQLLITLVTPTEETMLASQAATPLTKQKNPKRTSKANLLPQTIFWGTLLLLLLVAVFFFRKRRSWNHTDEDVLSIGLYRFHRKELLLTKGEESIELSHKEGELLSLLYASQNKTLDRSHILKVVWGDEGNYVGRTLDVFISKLRKKLEADPTVKITNIRGVGYKLILGAKHSL